ncbi:hypothetical protein HA402_002706 [Bradysia odoriphaga]|nr:hypothetical protein HA402_002706 [Bradysia odoriphaga]
MKCLCLKKVKTKRKHLGCIFIVMCAFYLIIYYNSKEVINFSVEIGREIVCKTFEASTLLSSNSDLDKAFKSPPVILETHFGLGNQLFQYAAAYSIARKRNSDLYICVEKANVHLTKNAPISMVFDPWDRTYGLGRFKIPHDKILIKPNKNTTCESLLSASKHIPSFDATDEAVVKCEIPVDTIVKVNGYFESEIFFHEYKEELLKMFVLNDEANIERETKEFLRQIRETESVCVHVRKGDFDSGSGRRLPTSYYSEAMALMDETLADLPNVQSNRTFFIFSDDIESVRKDFEGSIAMDKYRMVFVSNRKYSRYHDLFLMTRCRHSIMSNSTFSWWAAYLNRYKDKIVIAPLPKFKDTYNFWNHPYARLVKNLQHYWSYPSSYLVIQPKFA